MTAFVALFLVLSACAPLCEEQTTCTDCAQAGCVWVQWEDGSAECGADADDYPPADAAITTEADACSEE